MPDLTRAVSLPEVDNKTVIELMERAHELRPGVHLTRFDTGDDIRIVIAASGATARVLLDFLKSEQL